MFYYIFIQKWSCCMQWHQRPLLCNYFDCVGGMHACQFSF